MKGFVVEEHSILASAMEICLEMRAISTLNDNILQSVICARIADSPHSVCLGIRRETCAPQHAQDIARSSNQPE